MSVVAFDNNKIGAVGEYIKLPCRFVIHTPGPVWNGGKRNEAQELASCYRRSLEVAAENGVRSIAFPSISTGVYHFPLDQAADIAVRTARDYVAEHPDVFDKIVWVLFDDRTKSAYDRALE